MLLYLQKVLSEGFMQENYEKKGYLLEDFRLFHLKDYGTEKIEYHYHEFYKILFFISGKGEYFVEGKRYALSPGDIVLIEKHNIHRPEFEARTPCERMILYISPEFLSRNSRENCDLIECFGGDHDHVLRPDEKIRKSLFSIVLSIEQELSSQRYGKEIVASGILLRLLVELARSVRQKGVQKPSPMQPKSRQIQELVHYLETHLAEDISIDDLSERFYLSRYHMMRRFREETGTTIHSYLTDHRLMLARDLMEQGMPATEVCFHCGFGSYSSFSRAYGKFFGTTPTGRVYNRILQEGDYE